MYNISKANEAYIRVQSDDSGALMELSEFFTFYAEGYKFIPAFRNKTWDGKIRLYNLRNYTLPFGLLGECIKFAKDRGYGYKLHEDLSSDRPSVNEVEEYISSLNISARGKTINPYDYQIQAVTTACVAGRCLVLSPTGSGKSLIIYLMMRWFLEYNDEKVLIVVPTTSLVEQLYLDFQDYSSNDNIFDAKSMAHIVYSGKEKDVPEARITITTWQSAITCPQSWFEKYGMIVGDEAHLFKAKSLNKIMDMCYKAHMRIGTTGTLDASNVNKQVLIGNFGPVFKVTSTKELIKSKTLSDLKIQCIILEHDDALKKAVAKMDYASEIQTIVEHPGRNKFIINLALKQKGNSLIIFNFVEKHGKPLFKALKEAAPHREIYYVSGETDVQIREKIRSDVEGQDGAIIVASSATFSTGINIRNLHNIIFAAPTKSQIKVLQSIGRGLRLSDNGQGTVVYDICDDFSWKKKKNYTLRHGAERVDIYNKEGFNIKIFKIQMSL